MGKQISTAPKTKRKVKKMHFGGEATGGMPGGMFGGRPGIGPQDIPPGGIPRPQFGGTPRALYPGKPAGMPGGRPEGMPSGIMVNRPFSAVAGKPTNTLSAMATPMKKGGKVKMDGCCMKGKTKGKMC